MKPRNSSKKNTGRKLYDICLGNDFLDMTPKAETTKANIYKWNDIEQKKSSAQQRKNIKQKGDLQNRRKYSETVYLIKG